MNNYLQIISIKNILFILNLKIIGKKEMDYV